MESRTVSGVGLAARFGAWRLLVVVVAGSLAHGCSGNRTGNGDAGDANANADGAQQADVLDAVTGPDTRLDASDALAGDAQDVGIDTAHDAPIDASVFDRGAERAVADALDGAETNLDATGEGAVDVVVVDSPQSDLATEPTDAADHLPTDASVDAGCAAPETLCGALCTNTNTDPRHCGSCGNDCTALPFVNASAVTCSAGTCVLTGACQTGYGNCSGNPNDGCNVPLTDASNCGACGVTCSGSTPMCAPVAEPDGGTAYSCSFGCTASSLTACGSSCVNLQTDPLHCGSCSHTCPTPPNAVATCTAGVCGFTCVMGFHLCGSQCVDDRSTASCGASCSPCPTPANASTTCDGTTCGFVCNSGFGDCDGDATNGCETSLTTAQNCGSCASACATGQACANGQCVCNGTSCPSGCCSAGTCNAPSLTSCGAGGGSCTACDPIGADRCTSGACRCGGNAPCPAGQHCISGACFCDATSCPGGCCNANTCTPASLTTCGVDGGACVYCSSYLADSCTNGSCNCGSGPACSSGQQCVNGTCTCTSTSCPYGCCSGGTCFTPAVNHCGAGSRQCVTCGANADRCDPQLGMCECGGSGTTCQTGTHCVSGQCVCDSTSCPNGCCYGPAGAQACITATSTFNCGADGAMCVACSTTLANNCTNGQCVCGANPACGPGQHCSNNQCVCDGTSCSGCCLANVCYAASIGSCGSFGSMCYACDTTMSDGCTLGSCTCGSGSSCVAGRHCLGGACVCDGTSCPNGCCSNGLCNSSTAAHCGTGGVACSPCTVTGASCVGGACLNPNGMPCTSSATCASGFCVDGFCCNTACTDPCGSCSSATSLGPNGTCSATWGPGTPSCSPYVCSGQLACPTACGSDAVCASGLYCRTSDSTCQPKGALGTTCTAGNQCGSGNCVEGVCCDTGSCGGCNACNLPGSMGTCSPVPAGSDPHQVCTGICNAGCNGTGGCGFQPAGTQCLAPMPCTNYWPPNRTNQAAGAGDMGGYCNGTSGACQYVTCNGFICGTGGACETSCATDADCVVADYCSGGRCVARQSNGTACTANTQCQSLRCNASLGQCAECSFNSDCSPMVPYCINGVCSTAPSCAAGCYWGICPNGVNCTCSLTSPTCNDPRAPSCNGAYCGCGTGSACPLGEVCAMQSGVWGCYWPTGTHCVTNYDCASGVCNLSTNPPTCS